jgi:Ca2+-binding EF-hand superfamily protein
MHLRSKFPLKNNGEIQEMMTDKSSNFINEEEWVDIVQYMYNETDSDILTFQIREVIKKKYYSQNVIKKKQRLSREEMQLQKEREKAAKGRIAYKDFIKVMNMKILLDFQLKGHEKFLEKFLGFYRDLDTDKDGVIDENQFRELIATMAVDMTEDDIVRMLQIVDPFNHQKITFSDCVNLFSSVGNM